MGEQDNASNPLDDPNAAQLVKSMYMQARIMAEELNDPEYASQITTASDWVEYATGLAGFFRGLDFLLTQGAPFPEEWVLGITTP